MRIAQVTKYFYPRRGGIESHVEGISEEFIKKGHSVTVYTSKEAGAKNNEEYKGIRVLRSKTWFTLFNGPFTPGILVNLLLGEYDLIHVHLPDPVNSVFALIASKIKKKPLYVTYHADLIKEEWFHKPFTFIYGFFLDMVLDAAVKIMPTTPSYVAKSQIPDKYRKKIVVAPNFVDVERFNPYIDGSRVRRELNCANKKIIFFLGRLVPYKGVEYIIKAFREAKKEVGDAVLIVGGRGPLKEKLMKLASELEVKDVVFTEIEDKDIPEYYAACDLFVLPSVTRQEAFGIALLEAMACGKPTITTNISGMPYVVGDAGLQVEPGNVEELTQAMLTLLRNEELRKELGERGRRRVESEFTQKKVAEKILEIYGVNR